MVDVHTPKIRSKNMRAIKSSNTKIEYHIFTELRKRKIYFRKHYKIGKISIDVALPRKKIAVFIDGDFWHGYKYSELKKRLPNKYWVNKIESNIKRDRKNRNFLRKNGWKVMRVCEHQIKMNQNLVLKRIENILVN